MTIKCTWGLPATRKSGRPVTAADVTGYQLSMQVEGAPDFTVVGSPAATATEFDVDATDPGTYNFKLCALNKAGIVGDPAVGSVTIDDTSPLGAPQNFVVALQ